MWAALLPLLASGAALGGPSIDGIFDPFEGYTSGWQMNFSVENSSTLVTGGELWVAQDSGTGDVSVAFIQPLSLVDNSYGANSVGWGSDAPSGKHHNLKDLLGSDKAQFVFTDGLGNTVLDATFDYFTQVGGGYDALGVTGGDGKVSSGSSSSVLAWSSSLDYNFNVLGHQLTTDSPATDDNYTPNPSYPGWEYKVVYELQVAGDLFATNGFGGVSIPIVHDSPNKIGKNKVYPTPDGRIPPVPEPTTLAMLGFGGLGLVFRRRRAG